MKAGVFRKWEWSILGDRGEFPDHARFSRHQDVDVVWVV